MDKDIDYVVAVSECKSISKAADILFISQPSLSRYISKLEQDLGLKLFFRSGSGVNLTEAGQVYVSYAKEIKRLQSTMERRLYQMKLAESSRQISVCMTLNTGTLLTGKVAEKFGKRYPEVQLEFINVMSKDIPRLLEEKKCDFAIGPDVCDHTTFSYDIMTSEHFILAVPVKYNLEYLAEKRQEFRFPWIDISCLPQIDLIFQESSCNVRKEIDRILKDLNVELHPIMEFTNSILTIQAVERQLGCCFLSESFLPYITNRESMRYYCVGRPEDVSTTGAIYEKERQLTNQEKYCIACVKKLLIKSKDDIREEFLKVGV